MEKIGLFIPCYNIARRIRRFLLTFDQRILERIEEIVVVDNASEDSTLKILKTIKEKNPQLAPKIKIFSNRKNYGLGGSHKIVFDYFVQNKFSHVLTIPSSYKGSPAEIAHMFLDAYKEDPEVEVIFGSRPLRVRIGSENQWVSQLSKKIVHHLDYLISDLRLSDIGSRFVFLNIQVLEEIPYKSLSDDKSFNLQFNVLIGEAGKYKIQEIPLKKWRFASPLNWRQLRYTADVIKTLSRYGVNKHVFQKSGWRLFSDFPDNISRDYEVF